jgi:PAT family beta-lactamase induction signal transducer AmpG
LYIADGVSWHAAYAAMVVLALVGIAATLLAPEELNKERSSISVLLAQGEEPARNIRNIALIPVLLAWIGAGWIIVQLMAAGMHPGEKSGIDMKLAAPLVLAAVVGVPILVAFVITRFPMSRAPSAVASNGQTVLDWLYASILAPLVDFVRRYWWSALLILSIVLTYRLADMVMGKVANVFYLDMGYTKSEIATVTKVYGVIVTIAGQILAGVLIFRYGIGRLLVIGAVLTAAGNLVFAWVALHEKALWALTAAITFENLAGGLAGTVLIAYMSRFASKSHTATQYALFSSLFTLPGSLIGGFGGDAVDQLTAILGSVQQGYAAFFVGVAILGLLAVILSVWWLIHDRARPGSSDRPGGRIQAAGTTGPN